MLGLADGHIDGRGMPADHVVAFEQGHGVDAVEQPRRFQPRHAATDHTDATPGCRGCAPSGRRAANDKGGTDGDAGLHHVARDRLGACRISTDDMLALPSSSEEHGTGTPAADSERDSKVTVPSARCERSAD